MELKKRMTYEEMARHLEEKTGKIPSRVNVGKYARENGYKVYKPMLKGRITLFYLNESINESNTK